MPESLFPTHPILLVDDDEDLQRSYAYALRNDGLNHLVQCTDSRLVEQRLAEEEFEIVLLDLNMPYISGRDLLPRIVQQYPEVPVVVITGVDEVGVAVKCMRNGAFDYMVKPIEEEALLAGARRAIEVRGMRRENVMLKERLLASELSHPEAFAHIVTQNATMHGLFRYVEAVAGTPQPILITGETGVGKELVAKAVHSVSELSGRFVPVNIAGVDDTVFSDTLFGHVKGAFTGAAEPRKGLIEQASGGTLFLDEIGDLNNPSQVKLLRLIQEREYFPLGSDLAKRTDARIVVATNRNLKQLQQAGKFRDDLYYRLRSHHVNIPPLRERLDDLPILVDHFLAKAAKALGKKKPTPPRELFTLLSNYNFPGNVRELESMFYNAVSTHAAGILGLDSFKETIHPNPAEVTPDEPAQMLAPQGPLPTIREAEALLIDEAIRRTEGNQTMAADLLGITRQTLIRHLKKKKEKP